MDLPHDIMCEIMLNIALADLMNVRQVCKQFYIVASNEQYWRRRVERDYPLVNKPHETMTHRKYHKSLAQSRSFLQSLDDEIVQAIYDHVITVEDLDDISGLLLIYPVPLFCVWQQRSYELKYHLMFDVFINRINDEWEQWKGLSKGTDVILVTYQNRQPGGRNLPQIGTHLSPINAADYFGEADWEILVDSGLIDPNNPSRYQFFPIAAGELLVQDIIKQGYLGRNDNFPSLDEKTVLDYFELFEIIRPA